MTSVPFDGVWTSGVRRAVLPNGVTLLVKRDNSARVAAVVTLVKAGFFDEPDRWVGISHVLEHMFFKGTPRRGVGAIARETKALGGYLNASTTYDQTSYFVALPAENLARAIEIQADALQHASIDAGELERELKVIMQEARRKLDTPSALTHETLHEVMYDRHRMRRWRIGHEADLARLTRDDVWTYYRSRYVPERTIVSIVGDRDVDDMLDLARRAYEAWPVAPAAFDPSPTEPERREIRTRTLRGDVLTSELALGWRGVPALDPHAVQLDLAAAILASGRGSWLYQALRETGLATSASAYHYSPTELGVFSIGADFEPDRLDVVLGAVGGAVARLAADPPPEEDIERARTLALTRWARRMESMEGRAAALAHAEALQGIDLLNREYAALSATSAREVREAVSRFLTPDAISAVVYHPRDRGAELTPDQLTAAFRRPPPDPVARPPIRVPTRPASRTTTSQVEADVAHASLPGFDLLVKRKEGVPTVTVGVYLPRAMTEPAAQAGLSALTIRSAIRGAGELDAAGLAFAFEKLGGSVGSSVSHDWMGWGTTVLATHLGVAAALLKTILEEPRFLDQQVDAERGLLVEETRHVADDMFRYPFQLAFATAFGERHYGIPALGLPETLGKLEPDAVRGWHRSALSRTRGVVVAVGDVDPEQTRDELAAVFDAGQVRDPRPLDPAVQWTLDGKASERVVLREKAQTAVAMAFPGPSRRVPERHAAEVWAAVASGLGGRLFEALRDRKSLAYSVMASSWQRARGGAFVTYIATSPERETEARVAMLEELGRFVEVPISEEELHRSVNYLAGQVEVGRQTGAAIAGEIVEAWLTGGGLMDLEGTAERYLAVTADQVRQVARDALSGARADGIVRGTGATG